MLGIVLAGVANTAGLKAGNDLVANVQGLAVVVGGDVLAKLYNGAGALVAKLNGDIAKGIALVLVYVGAADTGLLNLYENLVITDFGNGELENLDLLCAGKNGDSCFFRDLIVCHGTISPFK